MYEKKIRPPSVPSLSEATTGENVISTNTLDLSNVQVLTRHEHTKTHNHHCEGWKLDVCT
jgi:hypothetical protein